MSHVTRLVIPIMCLVAAVTSCPVSAGVFRGRYFEGRGDVRYLQLLNIARQAFAPDSQLQSLPMLYTPSWNGFQEGPTWNAWWVQNSFGPTYCDLPFLRQPMLTFLQNSQNLWFSLMGDGTTKRPGIGGIAPNGCLCDDATPTHINYKQGDGRVSIHDWAMAMSAAGLCMQAELLLETRNRNTIHTYLPKLKRVANFVWTRHDPKNNLFLAGDAANLLGPNYAGYKKPNGTFGKAYLTDLSIVYIAALDRLIQLEQLVHHPATVTLYTQRRNLALKGLSQLTTKQGYFIKSLDPDGVRHGVYGAPTHGYFDTSCNVDAICFDIVGLAQAHRIYRMIKSIPGLRPHTFIIANYPSLDDMEKPATGLYSFGRWVNGGEWATVEARTIMAYYRLGRYRNAERSMMRWLHFARRFRLDSPLRDFGAIVSQPKQPINLTYDMFGIPAAMLRGLFEYVYSAKGLRLIPHIPNSIYELKQKFPVRFGTKHIYLCTVGHGVVRNVLVNGKPWNAFGKHSVFLSYQKTPATAYVQIVMGHAHVPSTTTWPVLSRRPLHLPDLPHSSKARYLALERRGRSLRLFWLRLNHSHLDDTFVAQDTRLVIDWITATLKRHLLEKKQSIPPVSTLKSRVAADQSFLTTEHSLYKGLVRTIDSYRNAAKHRKSRIYEMWREANKGT